MIRRALAALVGLAALVPSIAAADTLEPSQWPSGIALGGAPNALRFGGFDRYQTSLAMSLALRGAGGFPFDTPDRTSGGASSLAEANGWWGGATCPSAAIVVAGDTPADALAAAPLSDPTNRSDQPRLERVAAADPLFDPIGGFDRVDTFAAPIIVTTSGRSGAIGLASSARLALSDLAAGGCTTAREAIVVGGVAAVPREVEAELVSLGYEEVFRVAGGDRYETAARIATALGTESAPPDARCADSDVTDEGASLGFHGNAVVEYRPDPVSCQVLGRAVVLAEGGTGADALAAGWWTSLWQVPVLLTAPDGGLPAPTAAALQSMDIDTIIVLGGTARIPEPTVDEAKRLAGAVAGRFAGRDRYDTSVQMAQVFGGWYPTGDPSDAVGSRVCLAASGGSSAAAGWPDALAAGPWCGRLSASGRPSPERAPAPAAGAAGPTAPAVPALQAAPVLLVPAGAETPTSPVAELLNDLFPSSASWCRGGSVGACRAPGFAVAFGGSSSVSDGALGRVSALLAGNDVEQRSFQPRLGTTFLTSLDLAPVYAVVGDEAPGDRVCLDRGSAAGIRWLAGYGDLDLNLYSRSADLAGSGLEGDGGVVPLCAAGLGGAPAIAAIAGDGTIAGVLEVGSDPHRTSMSDRVSAVTLAGSGAPGPATTPGTTTTWTFGGPPAPAVTVTVGEASWTVADAVLELVLVRDDTGTTGTFGADVVLQGAGGERLVGSATGEAVLVGERWELAGRVSVGKAAGGFRASLLTYGSEAAEDDDAFWQLDALQRG